MITRDVVSITATNALITLGGLVSGIVVARMLGPEGRGQLATILLWPGIVGYIGTFGADIALGRRSAANRATLSQNVFIATVLAFAYGFALLIPFLVTLPLLFGDEQHQFVENGRVAMLVVPAIILQSYLGAIALGAGQLRAFNAGRIALTAGYIALILLSWLAVGSSLTGVTVAYLLSVWFGTLLTLVLLKQRKSSRSPISIGDVRDVARRGMVFAPGYAVFAITNNLSILWLVVLSDSRSLGLYAVALTFANAQQIISQALAKTAFVRTAQVDNEAKISKIVAIHLRRSLLTLGGLAALFEIGGPWIVPWIFGTQFVGASAVVIYLVPGVACFAFGQIVEEMLKGRGVATPSVLARLTSALFVSICATLLIPRSGSTGMAISFLLGGLVECLVFLSSLRQRVGVSILDLVVSGSRSQD